jgi:ribosome-interacting GTPase 1
MGVLERIADIEAEMERTQRNKATARHLGLLKAQLAKLRREIIDPKGSSGGGKQEGFDVAKTGDARIGFVGFPSVGKVNDWIRLTMTIMYLAIFFIYSEHSIN